MRENLRERWVGILLTAIGVVGTVWLAFTGNLDLYIHPRYTVFTVVAAVAAGVAVLAAAAFLPAVTVSNEHEHEHRHDSPEPGVRWLSRAGAIGTVALLAGSAIAILLLPPSTLNTAGVTSSQVKSVAATNDAAPDLGGGDTAAFTVKDWAALLRQGATAQSLAGKQADVVGFVTRDSEDPSSFYLVRLSVTCCAVDAQPIGIPVHLPGWDQQFPEQSWVRVTGAFVANPSAASTAVAVLQPAEIERIDEPDEPYVF